MKSKLGILLIAALAALAAFWFLPGPEADPDPVTGNKPPAATPTARVPALPTPEFPKATPPPVNLRDPGRPALQPPDPANLQNVPPHPDAVSIGTGVFSPQQELQVLTDLFRLYREEIGSVPVGESNAQFMHALRGNNPERLGWFPLQHPRLNEKGELLDSWGTPYFLHALSRTHLEIRSAGPDRNFYTDDDLAAGL